MKNQAFFMDLLHEAKDIYKPLRELEVIHRKKEAEEYYTWTIPVSQGFTERAKLETYTRNILSP